MEISAKIKEEMIYSMDIGKLILSGIIRKEK